jgi:hypothetical protein
MWNAHSFVTSLIMNESDVLDECMKFSKRIPLYVDGQNFDFDKHVLKLLTNAERAEWSRVTINHLKWKYINAIMSSVHRVILFVFGRLPKKYWPAQHQEALKMARDYIL